jgi:hypothetical protein
VVKKRRDFSQVALGVAARLTGGKLVDRPDPRPEKAAKPEREKNPAAVALSKLGASKGGKARAQESSASRRKQVAERAADARWAKKLD